MESRKSKEFLKNEINCVAPNLILYIIKTINGERKLLQHSRLNSQIEQQ